MKRKYIMWIEFITFHRRGGYGLQSELIIQIYHIKSSVGYLLKSTHLSSFTLLSIFTSAKCYGGRKKNERKGKKKKIHFDDIISTQSDALFSVCLDVREGGGYSISGSRYRTRATSFPFFCFPSSLLPSLLWHISLPIDGFQNDATHRSEKYIDGYLT